MNTAQNLVSDIDPVLRASEGPGLYLDASPDSELAKLLSDIVFFINKYKSEGVHLGGYVVIKTDAEDNITHVPELVIKYKVQHRPLAREQTALLEQMAQEVQLMEQVDQVDQESLQELEGQEEEVSQDGLVAILDLMVHQ